LKNQKLKILTQVKRAYCTLNLPVVSLYVGPIVTHKNCVVSLLFWMCEKSDNEDGCLLGCCAVWSGRCLLKFQRCLLPPSSGRNNPEDSHLHTRRRENLKSRHIWYFAVRLKVTHRRKTRPTAREVIRSSVPSVCNILVHWAFQGRACHQSAIYWFTGHFKAGHTVCHFRQVAKLFKSRFVYWWLRSRRTLQSSHLKKTKYA
jgi:hypothetical protein